jgi:peptidyl-prolyl cis-trans isomerase SurA
MILAMAGPARADQMIVALVNDEPISAYDVSQRLRFLVMTSGKKPSAALRKEVIEQLIAERLKLQEAKKLGVTMSEDRVTAVLKSIASRNKMPLDKLVAGLKRGGVNIRTFRQRIKSNLIWRSVVQNKFRHQVNVSASQVDAALSSSEGDGKSTTEFHLKRVRLEHSDDADQETIAERLLEAEGVRGRFRSCDKIEDVLKGVRHASIKAIGRKRSDQLAQPSRALVMKAKAGQMTPPNITPTGVELYAVCSRRVVHTNAKARQAIERKMQDEEFNRLATRYFQDLRRDAYIEYRSK